MRFLLNVIDDRSSSATDDEGAAIDAFNDRLVAEGRWVLAAGVAHPADSTVVDARSGEPSVTPGPVNDTAEWVAGFWIIDAADVDTARDLAIEGSRACGRRVELRPFLG
ncbi:YciI family protein [Microbacterium sp. NPDC016588]